MTLKLGGAMRVQRVLAMGGVILLAGCTGPATIYLRDGKVIRGPIVGHQGQSLLVRAEPNGVQKHVAREDIDRIDHPGWLASIILAVTAGVMSGVAFGGGAMMRGCDLELDDDSCKAGFFMFVIGGPLALLSAIGATGSLLTYDKSTSAAGPTYEKRKEN